MFRLHRKARSSEPCRRSRSPRPLCGATLPGHRRWLMVRGSLACKAWTALRRRCDCRYGLRQRARMKSRANCAAGSRSSSNGRGFPWRVCNGSNWQAYLISRKKPASPAPRVSARRNHHGPDHLRRSKPDAALVRHEARVAPAWFVEHFHPESPEDMMQKYPQGSEENTHIRMVISYWDMVAGIVNRGLINDELFFESNGEIWVVWDRMRLIVPTWRGAFKNPHLFQNIEETCKRLEAWREKRAPGSSAAMRQMLGQGKPKTKGA